ncbi:hypothetical protein RhiirA4_539063 [Rhizophagus irregularis]|uniref:Uncharacterized protein n=1 Tax=Rhizophagus irregularis TaxID=588596 RepID=A0A2I1G2D1_9GLOM|nr:hypothetical protein RhiirA4_539063 [Rhizophagus irregularis]
MISERTLSRSRQAFLNKTAESKKHSSIALLAKIKTIENKLDEYYSRFEKLERTVDWIGNYVEEQTGLEPDSSDSDYAPPEKKAKPRRNPVRAEEDLGLDDDDLEIIRKRKIMGRDFLKLTEEKFMQDGLERGPATRLADFAKECKEKKLRSFSSYLSLSEVLAEYGYDSDGIDSIPLFSPPTYEIQDDNKIFKRCMEEVLGRLRTYGTLQPDSLEAMRNEYVVALLHHGLHAGIHIVMDITNKDLSMRPQYGIVGEESRDRVDYAIKEAEDLICITEDRQHKVPLGFAQNIKQLQSACETNKRKRKRGDDDFDYLYGYGLALPSI